MASTTLPSVMLSNLPAGTSVEKIMAAFQNMNPTTINLTGGMTAHVTFLFLCILLIKSS